MKRPVAALAALICLAGMLAAGCGGGGGAASPDAAVVADTGETPGIKYSEPPAATLQQGDPVASAMVAGSPPADGASADGTMNSWYVPEKAFDGDCKSWWVGEAGRGAWDLYYGFAFARTLEQISINFYGTNYVPGSVELKLSSDGVNWTDAGAFPAGDSKPELAVSGQWRYIWIRMQGNPAIGYPLIREVDWLPVAGNTGVSGGPGANEDWYFPDNAFDGDMNTWWVGKQGAGAWDLYYVFDSPQFIQMIGISFFNINYVPANTTLLVSDDGISWIELGALGPGPNTSPYTGYFHMGQTVKHLHIRMQGAPPSTFPLIKDVSFEYPLGASSGDSKDTFYKAANAFDGNPDTWWVGDPGKQEWDLFTCYAESGVITSAAVSYYSVNHAPSAMSISSSVDGQYWEDIGTFAPGASPAMNFTRYAKCLRFHAQGAPATGFPLVKDISIGTGSQATWDLMWGNNLRHDNAWVVRQSLDGGYFAAGFTEWSGNATEHYNDAVVMKLDKNGGILWQSYVDVSGTDYAYSMTPTTDGGVAIGMYSSGGGGHNPYVVKLNSQGTEVWRKALESGSYATAINSMIATQDGGLVLVVGSLAWIVGLDASGNTLWTQQIAMPGGGALRSVDHVRSRGGEQPSGFILSGTRIDPVTGRNLGWLVRTDDEGNLLWQQTFQGNWNIELMDAHQTQDGGFITAGFGDNNHQDYYILKTDSQGAKVWDKYYGDSQQDDLHSVAQTADGGYAAVGWTWSNGLWIVKLNSIGDMEWNKNVYGTGGSRGRSVISTDDGGILLAACIRPISLQPAFVTSFFYLRKIALDGSCPGCTVFN